MAYIGRFRNKWRAQIQRHGVRVSKTFETKRLVQAWVVEQEAKATLAETFSLQQAVEKYLETVSVTKRDAVGWETRRFAVMLGYFGNVPLGSITSSSISEWRTERVKTVSGSTILR